MLINKIKNVSKKNFIKSLFFLLILALLLSAFSWLSMRMYYPMDPMKNFFSQSIYQEKKDSIDVITIGTSNVYSSVSPLNMWEDQGFTSFTYGEASQRIYETRKYLKKIYKTQSPKVVLIDVGYVFRDCSDNDNLDSMVKSQIAKIFPVVTYHLGLKQLNSKKIENLATHKAPKQSITKGYFMRPETKPVKRGIKKYMLPSKQDAILSPIAKREVEKCISLCEKNGSSVILLSVPCFTDWNMKKHNTLQKIANETNTPFLDLNIQLKEEINWKKDTCDNGSHLNMKGADTVSSYLGNYLMKHYQLTDHRNNPDYEKWNDWAAQYKKYKSSKLDLH